MKKTRRLKIAATLLTALGAIMISYATGENAGGIFELYGGANCEPCEDGDDSCKTGNAAKGDDCSFVYTKPDEGVDITNPNSPQSGTGFQCNSGFPQSTCATAGNQDIKCTAGTKNACGGMWLNCPKKSNPTWTFQSNIYSSDKCGTHEKCTQGTIPKNTCSEEEA